MEDSLIGGCFMALIIFVCLVLAAVAWGAAPQAAPLPSGKHRDGYVNFMVDLLARVGTAGLPPAAIITQSHLETGGGTSRAFNEWNNLFGIHGVGPANRFWDGRTAQTTRGEVLRVYRSPEDSLRDYLRLITESGRYKLSAAIGRRGDVFGYYSALRAEGYEGPAYDEKLRARHKVLWG